MLVASKYRLVEPIGEGGMGSVWRAKHEVTEREVALKFLSSLHTETPALLQRFLREAKMAGRLRHPGLIEVFDAGVDDEIADGPYLVMELLDGVPLDQALQRAGRFSVGLSLEILHGVASAMVEVHAKGIVHRDLKPANVFLHRPGTGALVTKVLDFGIGKISESDSPESIRTLTRSGVIVGSPRYMSPEQAAGDTTIDARSDIHAMGALLWECIAGRPLFGAVTPTSLAAQILAASRPRLDEVQPDIPRTVADLVAESLSIDREARPSSASVFAARLEQAMATIGYTSMLAGRSGADRFMALLRADFANVSAGTSLLSEAPHGTEASAPPVAVSNRDALGPTLPTGPAGTQIISHSARHEIPTEPAASRTPAFKKAMVVVGVLCAGAGVGVVATHMLVPSVPLNPGVADSVADVVASTVPDAAASVTTSVAAMVSSAPPVESALPVAVTEPPVRHGTSRPSRTAKTSEPPPTPKSTATQPSVHHGITESGL